MTSDLSIKTHTVYTTAQVRELDRLAIEECGIHAYTLMERAGQALLRYLKLHWPKAQRICVVCGMGNNGGDGYVLGRLARQQGIKVTLLTLAEPANLTGAARQACQDYFAAGGVIDNYQGELPDVDVIVDAIFGTGLTRALEGAYKSAIDTINQQGTPVLSADIPSGLNADTGQVFGNAIKAHVTVTFMGLKQGLLTGQARDYTGQIHLESLSIPPALYKRVPDAQYTLSNYQLRQSLKPRARSAHKGQFGHCLLIGGAAGMSGAIRLAGEAALRVGSGLVSIATHPSHAAFLNLMRPELMVHSLDQSESLRTLMLNKTVLAIGPGLGQNYWADELLRLALTTDCPLVVDADALNLLANLRWHNERWVLTPHPGEASRLLNCTVPDIERDRVAAAKQLQQQYGGVIVLKGAGTLVASAQNVAFCTLGNPGMASGGMGDILTGMITGLIAQGLNLQQAAELGVYLHAHTADQAAQRGERGLLASDVLGTLRAFVNPATPKGST
ncbi:bifunctional ADP-dependent NAD(P)H-hydrate dehydratase/NAD(P)H-hydrate epimerase [Thiolinea disciformis]|uniref:bifunctional ADP-dependent NAD(P)H-hydrate dehydratase/NAD(P)H-hydrate epimerase n=1 Tax=Thiolinea disciformis TaxID=125614 RepID=UPI000363911F|nr:bifunctional ADP-dependent NAD(P)H-hydrate dehydratase/NAD(P)H-hydrate epimerase [Thiolinea disciformis]